MIDRFIYRCFDILDKVCESIDNLFKKKKKK